MDSLVFLPQGDLMAICLEAKGGDRLWQLWSIKELRLLRMLDEFPKSTTHLAFIQGGKKVLSVGEHGDVGLWEFDSKRQLRTWKTCNPVKSIGLSQGGRFFAVDGQSEVQVVDLLAGDVRRFTPRVNQVLRLAFSRNDRWLAASDEGGGIQVWDTTDWQEAGALEGTTIPPPHLCPAPDSVWILRRDATGRRVGFTDARTGNIVRTMETPDRPVFLVACSPDGKLLVTGQEAEPIVAQPAPTGKSAPSRSASGKSAPVTEAGTIDEGQDVSEGLRIIFWNTDTRRPQMEYRRFLGYGELAISWTDNLTACMDGNEVVLTPVPGMVPSGNKKADTGSKNGLRR